MLTYYADPELIGLLLTFQHRKEAGEPVRILLAEGDSWFSLGGFTSNLLMELDDDNTLIVSCAHPGDTIRNMARLGNDPLWMMLSPRFGAKWDAVLLSAGGNDLLGDVGLLIDHGNLSREAVGIAMDRIELGYRRIISAVREHHDCPIHAHTYDYPISDPYGGLFRMGPWIGNRLIAAGVAPHRHEGIIAQLVDGLANRLRKNPDLVVHETRGTLPPGKWRRFGWQAMWRNELHPTREGYKRLAAGWML